MTRGLQQSGDNPSTALASASSFGNGQSVISRYPSQCISPHLDSFPYGHTAKENGSIRGDEVGKIVTQVADVVFQLMEVTRTQKGKNLVFKAQAADTVTTNGKNFNGKNTDDHANSKSSTSAPVVDPVLSPDGPNSCITPGLVSPLSPNSVGPLSA